MNNKFLGRVRAVFLTLFIILVGDYCIQNYITPISGSGFPTDTLKAVGMIAVVLCALVIGITNWIAAGFEDKEK